MFWAGLIPELLFGSQRWTSSRPIRITCWSRKSVPRPTIEGRPSQVTVNDDEGIPGWGDTPRAELLRQIRPPCKGGQFGRQMSASVALRFGVLRTVRRRAGGESQQAFLWAELAFGHAG